jgi:hypothetical protein
MFLYVCVCFEDFIDIGETMRQRNEFTTQSSLAADDDEFERMLEEFINSEFEMAEQALPDEDGKTGGEPPHGEDDATDEDDEDAAADASDDDDDDEDAFDDDDDDDDEDLDDEDLEDEDDEDEDDDEEDEDDDEK